jgi:transposase
MRPATAALTVTDGQHEILEKLGSSQTAPHREVTRAKALLMAEQGLANTAIAANLRISPSSVVAWRKTFLAEGVVKFGEVHSGRGRKPSIPAEKIDEIVQLTQESKPEGETHWSCRSMAKAVGVSPATVQRVWSSRGLKPHLVRTLKLSNDPKFEEKLIDVVGLYLNPEGCKLRNRPLSSCAGNPPRSFGVGGSATFQLVRRLLDMLRLGPARTRRPSRSPYSVISS